MEALDLSTISASQRAIEELARRIQMLPAETRWVYADQDVIRAQAMGVPATPGLQTARIKRLLELAAKIGLDVVAAKCASFFLVALIRCRQSPSLEIASGKRFFVGISALKEADLIRQFEIMSGGIVTVIDQRFSGALGAIYAPGWVELLQSWRDAARPVFAAVRSNRSNALLDRWAVLTYIVRKLHHYAHFLAVFRGFNRSHPDTPVAFSSADLPAFAAARAGVKTIYFAHGFQRRSLVLPDFNQVVGFNAPESEHLRSRLPQASVTITKPVIRPISVTQRVAVVGDYVGDGSRSRGFIELCRAARIPVVVRPHPADYSGYWATWHGTDGVTIDRDGTFDEFLNGIALQLWRRGIQLLFTMPFFVELFQFHSMLTSQI